MGNIQFHPLLTALVVAVPTGPDTVYCALVHGTPALLEDIDEALSSRDARDSLGKTPGPGVWIWEGRIRVHKTFEGDVDVDYDGKYRPATSDEVARLRAGVLLEGWEVRADEESPEEGSPFALFPET